MKVFILLSVVIAAVSARDLCACPRIYDPVCGHNGMTYGNKCELTCAGATQVDMSQCKEQKECACGFILSKVCGKDGVTYPNECTMKCWGVEKDHDEECGDRKKRNACQCPEQIELPVCATNGITYNSMCDLGCAQAQFRFLGQCDPTPAPTTPAPTEAAEVFICTADYNPVCGDDGVTYPNLCVLNNTENVNLAAEGECPDDDDDRRKRAAAAPAAPADPAGAKCSCPNQLDLPVCGKDGVTYNNMCALGCGGAGFRFLGHCPVTPAPGTTAAPTSDDDAAEATSGDDDTKATSGDDAAEADELPCTGDDCGDDN